ncbi:MAG: NAD-dependent epimerase/dehydratase family protein, partial [Bacteroidota bacterium]
NEFNTEAFVWKNSPLNSAYSLSKYQSELEVWRVIEEGLPAVIVNPSVILGPNEWQSGTAKFFELVYSGLKFYTKGTNGYVDVRDVANVMIQLMESDISAERFIISSENLNYQKLFSLIAHYLHKKPPQIEAGKSLSKLAVVAGSCYSFFSGKKPFITKETARTAQKSYYYSNNKISTALNFNFIPIEETIKETSEYFLKTY